jgi:hypothetical protein
MVVRDLIDLKINENYRWLRTNPYGYSMWEDFIIDELRIEYDPSVGLDMLVIYYKDLFGKIKQLSIDTQNYIIVDHEYTHAAISNQSFSAYRRLLISPNERFPTIEHAEPGNRFCNHTWADTGQMLWSFCTSCNATGDWSREKSKYEVKK